MLAYGLPEASNARLLPFEFEMRRKIRNDDQGRAGADCCIGDASAVCGSAKSDLLLHEALPYDVPQHLRISFGVPQLCGSVRGPGRLSWRGVQGEARAGGGAAPSASSELKFK
jgi:hypothetical protein